MVARSRDSLLIMDRLLLWEVWCPGDSGFLQCDLVVQDNSVWCVRLYG